MTFDDLDLIPALQEAVASCGYTTPTPIQVQAIPPLLAGRDLMGCAQTGTGKTAAFALPVLQRLAGQETRPDRRIRSLVLSPTRELSAQIDTCFRDYGQGLDLRVALIHGGVSQQPQVRALEEGVDILVATPGRLLDLIAQGHIDLSHVTSLILDEADRMLDMGFIHDVQRILALLPAKRQSALFSATLPQAITDLGASFLRDPVSISVAPDAPTLAAIRQLLYYAERDDKKLLLAHLLRAHDVERAIVFTRTRHRANRLVRQLTHMGFQTAAIHGEKSQSARTKALAGFKDGSIPVLIATDVAARGIDVDNVSHVFQFDLPFEADVYVHRIGRTGRAGREGVAVLFCDSHEVAKLREIERLTGQPLRVDFRHEWHSGEALNLREALDRRRGGRTKRTKNRNRNRRRR
jgi:ATP-dependent RNA helicase RhlE